MMVGLAVVVAVFFVVGGCGLWADLVFAPFFIWVYGYGIGSGGGCCAVGEGGGYYAVVA